MTSTEQAYRAFRDQLSGYIARRLGGSEHVDDVLQDVFVRASRNDQKLAKAEKPLAWLYTVTNSVLIDHFRKQGRAVETVETDFSDLAGPDAEPKASEDFARCLLPLVENLPEKYREIIAYTDMEGGRQSEFARANNLNLATVKSRVQRGRKMLKNSVTGCCKIELDNRNSIIGLEPPARGCEPCC